MVKSCVSITVWKTWKDPCYYMPLNVHHVGFCSLLYILIIKSIIIYLTMNHVCTCSYSILTDVSYKIIRIPKYYSKDKPNPNSKPANININSYDNTLF